MLLVDDDATYRRALTAFLDASYDIDVVGETGSAAEAVTLAERLQPDAAVVDMAMPEASGIAVAARIRAAAPGTAVLLVSGNAAAVDPRLAAEAGIDRVLAKGDPLPVENALRELGRRR